MTELRQGDSAALRRPAPRYAAIEKQLERAIRSHSLAPGVVVTEDPVAKLFGTSRTPVRKAFNQLEKNGFLERFEGRGFVVAGADTPCRVAVTHDMLGLSHSIGTTAPTMSADRIAREFETAVAHALPFGKYRVHEQAAADHFEVSRTIIRELLSRFQDRGLVRKDPRSHWVVGPLTARDIGHYFAIRRQLEPLALLSSAPLLPQDTVSEALERTREATQQTDPLSPLQIEQLETDLHEGLLERTPNPHLLRMIHQSQVALAVNRVFADTIGTRPFRTALTEHSMVLEFIRRKSWDAAGHALEAHLRLSAERTRERLMSFSVFPEPVLPEYLRPMLD